jgi:hypothetical protein
MNEGELREDHRPLRGSRWMVEASYGLVSNAIVLPLRFLGPKQVRVLELLLDLQPERLPEPLETIAASDAGAPPSVL